MAEPGRGAPVTGGTPAEPVPAPAPAADGQLQLPNSQVLAQCEGNDDATDLQVLSRGIPEVDSSNGETNWDGLDLVSATRVALALTVASRAPAKVAHLRKLLKRLAIVVDEYALLKRPEAIAYLRTNPLDLRCTADKNGQKVLIGRVLHFLHSGIARTGCFARTVIARSVFLEVLSTEHTYERRSQLNFDALTEWLTISHIAAMPQSPTFVHDCMQLSKEHFSANALLSSVTVGSSKKRERAAAKPAVPPTKPDAASAADSRVHAATAPAAEAAVPVAGSRHSYGPKFMLRFAGVLNHPEVADDVSVLYKGATKDQLEEGVANLCNSDTLLRLLRQTPAEAFENLLPEAVLLALQSPWKKYDESRAEAAKVLTEDYTDNPHSPLLDKEFIKTALAKLKLLLTKGKIAQERVGEKPKSGAAATWREVPTDEVADVLFAEGENTALTGQDKISAALLARARSHRE